MNICILSTDQVKDDQRLLDAAQQKGHNAELYNIRDISMVLTSEKPIIYWRDQDITKTFDAIVPRLNVSFTDYGTNVLQQFICSETYVSESPEALRLGRDKLKSLQYLLARGLPFPATGIAYTPQGFRQLAKTIGTPMIVKLIESTEGTGIFLARNVKEMDNIVKTFGQLGASYVIQSFIEEAAGTDIRAFVIGGKVVAAMCRRSQDGDFRSNVALGGRSEPYQLTAKEEEIVLSATAAIGINVAGVDFIRADSGPMLLEVNVSPDFTGEQGIENVTGINIADAIIDHVVARVCNFYEQHYTSAKVLESPRGILCADG
ncbi:ribosomal protein S6--L-glutamate ligase [Arsukibacterium tuosuense]|uniref:Ribosomal protein S6--L-glutamate ligase n=1 Tax=Arsukibacterium tuosuense TaxID=1323745 RepID=A0A285ITQ7_9GAMM|nr:RimK family alpha-L-glutamate ligase [Arsukibacterium tuosuense]SNY51399.1 ribosomal protein S6--L-glutamate ligase [Arsukibacterium tuosuense]